MTSDWTSAQVLSPKQNRSHFCSGNRIISYLNKKISCLRGNQGDTRRRRGHISVTCVKSIHGHTYADYSKYRHYTRAYFFTGIPQIAHLADLGDQAGSQSLSASETTKGKIMPCLRGETRARKGDLFSSAARGEFTAPPTASTSRKLFGNCNQIYGRSGEAAGLLIVETPHPPPPSPPPPRCGSISHNRGNITRPTSGKYARYLLKRATTMAASLSHTHFAQISTSKCRKQI